MYENMRGKIPLLHIEIKRKTKRRDVNYVHNKKSA